MRLKDNPALSYACANYARIIPIFIMDNCADSNPWEIGAASKWWLHHSLKSLTESIEKLGGKLILYSGNPAEIIPRLQLQTGAVSICWNRLYEPHSIAQDTGIKAALLSRNIEVKSFNSSLLFEPWEIHNKSKTPFKVFTPFWRHCLDIADISSPLAAPEHILAPDNPPPSLKLDELNLLPRNPNWAAGFHQYFRIGENHAIDRLSNFLNEAVINYSDGRDLPSQDYTSRLSPHLHFGEISPRTIWHECQSRKHFSQNGAFIKAIDKFLSEIGWREFSHHLLYHFPHISDANFNTKFDDFPWQKEEALLKKWQTGETGIPIVDAGMRQLWQTGWMHNRVRMITASFLTKHLLTHWHEGAKWFWDTLVDANLANNSASWQWVAGSGADASPYFRIFNPVLQGEKFDPDGSYVKKWVPELSAATPDNIHKPWISSKFSGYPAPAITLEYGRNRALSAFKSLKA